MLIKILNNLLPYLLTTTDITLVIFAGWHLRRLRTTASRGDGPLTVVQENGETFLSNHVHVILHVDTDTAKNWNQDEVIERWRKLFGSGVVIERYLVGQCSTQAKHHKVTQIVETWRAHLMDINWFMRCLNESIARQTI